MDKNFFGKGGIDLKLSCEVVLDLIPLVKDGVASGDSSEIVNNHIKTCESCRNEFEAFEGVKDNLYDIKDKKIIFDIKRSIFITQLIILLAGAIVGVALSNSMGMFYNFLIMPIIGGVGYITLKEKWWLVPILVFILAYLWQFISGVAQGGFVLEVFYHPLFLSSIYTVLVFLGIVICELLHFTFKREE